MRIRSGDAEIFYDVQGSGPPLVLLHAFPTNHELWHPAAQLLAAHYRVVAPDLRGHGASETGEGPATMDKHAADLARVCEDAGIGRAVFAGASIGGYVLFEFWRRFRQRVAGLILCDTRAQADSEEGRAGRLRSAEDVEQRGPEPFLDSMVPKLLGQTTQRNRPDLVAAVRQMMSKMTAAGIAAVQRGMAQRPDSVSTLKTIDVPTLLLVGDEDTLTPITDAELMRSNIAGSRMAVIPRAGHLAAFEQHEEVARTMRRFLEGFVWE